MEGLVKFDAGQTMFVIYLYQWDHGNGHAGIVADCNLIPVNRGISYPRVQDFMSSRTDGDVEEFLVRMKAI